MTKEEIIEEFFNDMVKVFRGAAEQGFKGDELFALLELEAWKTKQDLLNKLE